MLARFFFLVLSTAVRVSQCSCGIFRLVLLAQQELFFVWLGSNSTSHRPPHPLGQRMQFLHSPRRVLCVFCKSSSRDSPGHVFACFACFTNVIYEILPGGHMFRVFYKLNLRDSPEPRVLRVLQMKFYVILPGTCLACLANTIS